MKSQATVATRRMQYAEVVDHRPLFSMKPAVLAMRISVHFEQRYRLVLVWDAFRDLHETLPLYTRNMLFVHQRYLLHMHSNC